MKLEAVLSSDHPCQAYVEGSVYSGNPLGLVIALYEGTIGAVRQSRECLASGDIWGRSTAVSKAVKLLTELLVSLDHKQGGEISANLKQLYSYMQCRLLDAHAQKADAPLQEVERLLNTMLDGWRGAADKMTEAMSGPDGGQGVAFSEDSTPYYGAFGDELSPAPGISAVF